MSKTAMNPPNVEDVLRLLSELEDTPASRDAVATQALEWIQLDHPDMIHELGPILSELAGVNEIYPDGEYQDDVEKVKTSLGVKLQSLR